MRRTLNIADENFGNARSALVHCGWTSTWRLRITTGLGRREKATNVDYLSVAHVVVEKYRNAYSRVKDNIYVSGHSVASAKEFANRVGEICMACNLNCVGPVELDGDFKRIQGIEVSRDKQAEKLFGRDTRMMGVNLMKIVGMTFTIDEVKPLLAIECWRRVAVEDTQRLLPGQVVSTGTTSMDPKADIRTALLSVTGSSDRLIYDAYGGTHDDAFVMFRAGIWPDQARKVFLARLLGGLPVREIVRGGK